MRTFLGALAIAAGMAAFASPAIVQSQGPNARPASSPASLWADRLEALRPSEPLAYFELAEEVADAGPEAGSDSLQMARHLFALAGVLDSQRLGASACLALAQFEPDPRARRRLLALTTLLRPPSGAGPPAPHQLSQLTSTSRWEPSAALAVCEALSSYRRGRGTEAIASLRKSGATELLQAFEHSLPGGFQRFVEDCKVYRGQSRPTITSTQVTRLMQVEQALLSGDGRSWSGDLLLSAGEPLLEVDPERLDQTLGVDGTRPYYRNGRWVSDT